MCGYGKHAPSATHAIFLCAGVTGLNMAKITTSTDKIIHLHNLCCCLEPHIYYSARSKLNIHLAIPLKSTRAGGKNLTCTIKPASMQIALLRQSVNPINPTFSFQILLLILLKQSFYSLVVDLFRVRSALEHLFGALRR